MTPSLMHPLTRRSFAALPRPARADFEAWFRNVLQAFVTGGDPEEVSRYALKDLRAILETGGGGV